MPRDQRLSLLVDLHDGHSLWHDSPRRTVRTRRLAGDVSCDVAIIGAGISGALTALTLAEAGHEVCVLDRREPGTGSTIASTAMIQFEIDTPLVDLGRRIGHRNAERAYLRSAEAVRDLGRLIERHDVDARWTPRRALYLAGNEKGWRGLEEEAGARRRIGLPSEFLGRQEVGDVFGIERTGAILSDGAAEIDPVRTAAGCLRAAQQLGASVYAPATAIGVRSGGDRVEITCEGEARVVARRAIFATGYEVVDGVPGDAFEIVSSWVIATKPVDEARLWPMRCLIWEASNPYLYLRTTRDNRIVAGGEDSRLRDPRRRAAAIPAKARTLMHKVETLLGRDDLELDYAWAGAFADSPTGLPAFTELKDLPGTFAILGCGGNGITFSVIGAAIVEHWLRGTTDPDADIFQMSSD